MELFYHLWGDHAKSQKLVLLHGMGGTGALWRPIAASLESEMVLLAPDQRGHGKSQIAGIPGGRALGGDTLGYTPLNYGRDIVQLLDKLGWQSVWILGHSMGVRTAVATAHLKPERVKGLILIDLGFSGVAGGGLGENLAHFLKILPQDFESREEARKFMVENCPDPAIAQYLMAVSVRNAEGRMSFPFDHSALIQTIEAARDASVRTWVQELGQRGMPVLVLRGAQSLVWSREEFEAEKLRFSGLPSIRFEEVEGAGHGLPFEKRGLLVEKIREWMGATVQTKNEVRRPGP